MSEIWQALKRVRDAGERGAKLAEEGRLLAQRCGAKCVRIYDITAEALDALTARGKIGLPLPEWDRIIAHYDPQYDLHRLKVYSPAFAPVAEGALIPTFPWPGVGQ